MHVELPGIEPGRNPQ